MRVVEEFGVVPDEPAAFSDGGPLVSEDGMPKTLSEALLRTSANEPAKGIVHVQFNGSEVFQSYPALLQDARRLLSGLYSEGLVAKDRAILQIESLQDFFPAFWACILGGITPVSVAVAPTYDVENSVVLKMLNAWKSLGRPSIIASESLMAPLSRIAGVAQADRPKLLSVSALRAHPPVQSTAPVSPDDTAFLQLSSGSTAMPKCIKETHRAVISHIQASRQFNGYGPDDVTLNWLAMDHVVPLLTFHVKDVYLGIQQIQAPPASILEDPLTWLDLIDRHRVTHSWSPNFGYKLLSDALARSGNRTWRLSSLKYFMNAGEQVTLLVVHALLRSLACFNVPPRVMQPAFGMAEVATCITYQNHFDFVTGVHRFRKSSLGGKLVRASDGDQNAIDFIDLGPPIPGVRIRIVDKHGRVLPEAVIGRLQIEGDIVTPGYLNNAAANQEAFVGDGWFNTGDLGFILDHRLTITGREKEMIVLYGVNYYSHEIEDIVNRTEGVVSTYAAACGIADARAGTEELAIFFSCRHEGIERQLEVIKNIRANVARELGVNPRYFVPIAKAAFPKTTSGKIQRTQLKTGLAAGDFNEILKTIAAREASAARVAPRTELESWLAEIWEQALDVRQIGIHDDFLDRGGDSLKAMQIWGRLRDAFPVEIPLGRILLECSTIAKLAEVIEETLIEKLQGLSEREAESLLQNDVDAGAKRGSTTLMNSMQKEA